MAPSGINNLIRADRGAIKRWYNQTVPKTTGGTSTAFTLSYSVAPTALADGQTHLVQFNAVNGVAPTLNVNALGALPLHYYAAGDWRVVPAGLWGANQILRVAYNSSAGTYRIIGREDRTGEVVPYAGATAPAGALLCSGQSLVRTEYPGLFAALGTAYGAADGTHFSLPDLSGRVPAGKEAVASRLTAASAGIDGATLGAAGGQQTVALVATNLPELLLPAGTAVPGTQSARGTFGDGTNPGTIPIAGTNPANTGIAHQNVQPTIVLNYIIRI
jgi:microcystin-dependent protein